MSADEHAEPAFVDVPLPGILETMMQRIVGDGEAVIGLGGRPVHYSGGRLTALDVGDDPPADDIQSVE